MKGAFIAGSHQAAEIIAAMYPFMVTCKKNGVDEKQRLTDVFERIQSHKHKDLYQLLPDNRIQFRNQIGNIPSSSLSHVMPPN